MYEVHYGTYINNTYVQLVTKAWKLLLLPYAVQSTSHKILLYKLTTTVCLCYMKRFNSKSLTMLFSLSIFQISTKLLNCCNKSMKK